jgi:hypothetical protein
MVAVAGWGRGTLVALLPVTHPLATRISLALTDLKEEPFIGYPSAPQLPRPPASSR